jgi:hypothetical protein
MSASASNALVTLRPAYEGTISIGLYYLHHSVSDLGFDEHNTTI